jgi:hypothetical protein
MGPPEDGRDPRRSQTDSRPISGQPRRRQCLLKGCETSFRPTTPLERYCSEECRERAREWSAWCADLKYRTTEKGKQRRQCQSKRYRERLRQRVRPSPKTPGDAGEGDRLEGFLGCPCDRPGCYELFHPTSRSPLQRFCSRACRMAWRRAIQRDRRWTGRERLHSFARPGSQGEAPNRPPRCSSHIEPTDRSR